MAISGGDGSIILTTKVDQKGLKSGLKSMTSIVTKSFAVIGAAAATATVAITKMATSAYADYEQLVGGVETLFKSSAQKVVDYANDAFYTAGVSANEYMKQVTSFSASLIRSTAGDTDKAADIANMALIDISDNVNKMGSSMESVTLAYQGFAKQQYMLLDNLKLGYGGTKTEMERLLKDAQALTGVKYDINNLADVYSAIHAIQEELGITGTTAKEAEKTITGSANMMKAAWKNVLSAISGGGDIDKAINNLVYSIERYFENIVPVVRRSLAGIGKLIEKIAPMLVENVASALIQSIPSLIDAVFRMILGLGKGIIEGVISIFTGKSGNATLELQTGINGVADSTSKATSETEKLGDAIEDASKQAKKSLAPFDTLQTLTSSLNDSTEDMFSFGANTGTQGFESQLDKLNEDMGKIGISWEDNPFIKKMNELFDTIKNSKIFETIIGFLDEALAISEKLQPVVKEIWGYVSNIYDWISEIIANNFWGKIIEAVEDVDKEFQTLESFLSGDFATTWNNVAEIFGFKKFGDGKEKIETATGAIEKFNEKTDKFLTFWETNIPKWFSDYVLPYFSENKWGETLDNIKKAIWEFFTGENGFFNTWNIELGKWWDSIVNPWFLEVKWSDLFKNVPRALGDVLSGIGGLTAVFVDSTNKLQEEVDKIFSKEHWEGIFKNITEAFDTIWNEEDGIVYKWRTGIASFWENDVLPFFEDVTWSNLGQKISDALWQGIKTIPSLFTNIINKVLDGFQSLVNGAIDLVNSFIDGYNGVATTLGLDKIDRFSGVDFSKYKIEEPGISKGTVIPSNSGFYSVLSENDLNRGRIANFVGTNNGDYVGGNTEVILEIDGREFGRAVVEQGNRENRRIGTRLVIG